MPGIDGEAVYSAGRIATLIIGLFAIGCGGGVDPREKKVAKELGETPPTLANLAGKVTVDGLAPAFGPEHPLQVILYDAKNPPPSPPLYALCSEDGSFRFMSRTTQPGVPEGSYVILFAALKRGRPGVYKEPDALKNLYNDADKNQEDPNFKIDLKAPGKTNCEFDLKLADRPAVGSPGPHAVVQLGFVKKR
jgi:hypothetical protein